jgi:hypothetical protein
LGEAATLKTEHFHGDEIEVSVASKDWQPAKTLEFEKDGFNYNIIKMLILADLKVAPEETKGYLGVFVNDEVKPRAVIESDLTFSNVFKKEIDVLNLPFGKHRLTLKMKSEQGYPVTNTFLEVHITRFYNLYEMAGFVIPLTLLGGP